jgi:hypothetical protein
VRAFPCAHEMLVELRDFVLFSSKYDVSFVARSDQGKDQLTPLVACVFSGMLCCDGIAMVVRGLYICSSADPKSLGVRGIG